MGEAQSIYLIHFARLGTGQGLLEFWLGLSVSLLSTETRSS